MARVVKLGIKRPVTQPLLPDPEPRPVKYTLISVDDHLMEPPHAFEGRMPQSSQARRRAWSRPRRATRSGRSRAALLPGRLHVRRGTRRREDHRSSRRASTRCGRAATTSSARIQDMDINGVWASVNFPSSVTGFGGTLFSEAKDPELGLACVRAWNDWLFEEWYAPYPERIVPLGITFLTDPELGAAEIRRNAKRGFTAVTMPEQPHRRACRRSSTRYWEPIIAACAETDTVL